MNALIMESPCQSDFPRKRLCNVAHWLRQLGCTLSQEQTRQLGYNSCVAPDGETDVSIEKGKSVERDGQAFVSMRVSRGLIVRLVV